MKNNKNDFIGLSRTGSTLITVIMVFAILSLLGISLLTATASNLKLTTIDRDYQAVYYIAEAGANKAIYKIKEKVDELSSEELNHDKFFEQLETFLNTEINQSEMTDFEITFGMEPSAKIDIIEGVINNTSEDSYTERSISYEINSKGKIGERNRTVSTIIAIAHKVEIISTTSRPPAFDYALFSPNSLSLPNQSKINGSIYSKDIVLESAGTQIINNIISETFINIKGNWSNPKVGGDVYAMNGSVIVSEGGHATVAGNVNANGDVIIGSDGTVGKNVYSIGKVNLKAANAKVLGDVNAIKDVILESGTSISGNAFLDGNLTLKNSNSKVLKNVYSGKNIYKENNTNILGISEAGGSINQHNNTAVNKMISPNNKPKLPTFPINKSLPVPTLSTFTSNKNKPITVPQSSPYYIIEPGIYGDLFVGGASTVIFKSGNYVFSSIDGARWGQKIYLDLSKGSINIYSVGDIKYTGPIYISEDGNKWTRMDELDNETAIRLAGKVYWETHGNFLLNNDANPRQWFGSVLANNNFTIGNPVKLIGAYIVNKGTFSLGNAPEIIYAPPTDSAAGGGEGFGDGNEGGTNIIPPGDRVKITGVIREK